MENVKIKLTIKCVSWIFLMKKTVAYRLEPTFSMVPWFNGNVTYQSNQQKQQTVLRIDLDFRMFAPFIFEQAVLFLDHGILYG